MIQSFLVYSILGLIMSVLGSFSARRQYVYDNLGKSTPFWVWDVFLALAVFAFISGIRWQVGVDHLTYLNSYLSLQKVGYSVLEKEWGFEVITALFASLSAHYTLYFAFLAFIQIFFIYFAFKEERYLYTFLGVVIIFGPHYISWMDGIRQMIVATVFVYAIHFIKEQKLVKFIIAILTASLIHKSALILLAFYFIPQKDYFRNRWLTYVLLILCLYLGSNNVWVESISSIGEILTLMDYDSYADNMDTLIEEEAVRNMGPRRLSTLLLVIVTIWFGPILKRYYNDTNFLIYFNLAIFGCLFYSLFANTSHVFLRPISYLTIFSVVTTAYLLLYLRRNLSYKNFPFFIAIFLLSISYLPMSIVAEYGKEGLDYTNYKFFWDNIYNF